MSAVISIELLARVIAYLERERVIYFNSEQVDGKVDSLAQRDLDEIDELIAALKSLKP